MDSWAACLIEEPWAWQNDANVITVLSHLLGLAATTTRRCGYETLACGDAVTSHTALSDATGLSVKQVRLALSKLSDVGELESIRRPRGLLLRMLRYSDWQATRMRMGRNAHNQLNMASTGQSMVRVKASKGQAKGRIKAGQRQSHVIYKNKEGLLNTNPPLSPPAVVCKINSFSSLSEQQSRGLETEGSSFQNQTTASDSQEHLSAKPEAGIASVKNNRELRQKENTALRQSPSAPDATAFRERLKTFVASERVFLSPSVIDKLCSEPIEYIGLVYEAAVEKRDGKSNVVFPHAVARYRADQGVLPRKATIDRLQRILNPPPLTPQSLHPRQDCPHCFGSGSVYGTRCECVGGKRQTSGEIKRLRLERDEAIRRIRQQLIATGDQT